MRTTESVRAAMVGFTRLAGDAPQRCSTCAFREGTDANKSILVPLQIEDCLVSGDTFMCHHGLKDDEKPYRQCAGYVALRDKLVSL